MVKESFTPVWIRKLIKNQDLLQNWPGKHWLFSDEWRQWAQLKQREWITEYKTPHQTPTILTHVADLIISFCYETECLLRERRIQGIYDGTQD